MQARNTNPFIVGDWIKRDQDFIGRRDLLDQFLSLQRRFSWLIGSRRMGKTSLLRCLQRRLRHNRQVLPVFWDVSGSSTTRDLLTTLLDSLDAGRMDLSQRNLVVDTDNLAGEDLYSALRNLLRVCRHSKIKAVMLIDEADALFKLFAQDQESQQKFKAVLDSESIQVIMASNHGLEDYDPLNTEHLLSPFLQSFVPAFILTAWSEEEARLLAARCTPDAGEQDRIIHVTGGLPFLVQMVCFYRCELGSLAVALDKIHDEHLLDLFFRHDMQCLGMVNSRMLALLGRRQPVALGEMQNLHSSEPSWTKRIMVLQQLGFIALGPDRHYRISNEFLQRWLQTTFRLESEIPKPPAHEKKQHRLLLEVNQHHFRIEWNGQEVAAAIPMNAESIASRQSEDFRSVGNRLYQQLFRHPSLQQLRGRLSLENEFFEIFIRDFAGLDTPYEWLHDDVGFLALRHAIIRIGAGLAPQHAGRLTGPVRMLLIASDTPPDIPRVDEELLLIREQLQLLAQELKRDIRVTCLFSHQSDLETVMNLTAAEPFHLIHYAGHAGNTADTADHLLYFNRLPDKKQGVKAVLLSEWLQCVQADVHLVYLNGCGVGAGIDLVGAEPKRISFIMANRWAVLDEMSGRFAVDFYRHLVDLEMDPIAALQLTRRQWAHPDSGDQYSGDYWLFPILWRQK